MNDVSTKKKMTREEYLEQGRLPVMEVKPFVVGYLVKLGVVEDYARTFSVFRAYDVLYRLLDRKIGKRKCGNIKLLYWLWTHGVALDALAGFTEDEAQAMLEMIWAAQRKKAAKP